MVYSVTMGAQVHVLGQSGPMVLGPNEASALLICVAVLPYLPAPVRQWLGAQAFGEESPASTPEEVCRCSCNVTGLEPATFGGHGVYAAVVLALCLGAVLGVRWARRPAARTFEDDAQARLFAPPKVRGGKTKGLAARAEPVSDWK